MGSRWIGRACLGALLAALLAPVEAHAHGHLVRSSPSRGDTLHVAPQVLRLEFNEAPELSMSSVRLLDSLKREIRLLPVRAAGDTARVLIAGLTGHLGAGRYTVAWQMTGRDGHTVRGEFTFVLVNVAERAVLPRPVIPAVGTVAAGRGVVPNETHRDDGFDSESLSYVLIRWAQFLGLLVVIGAFAFHSLVLPQARLGAAVAHDASARARRLASAGVLVLALSAVARLIAQWVALRIDATAPSAMPLTRVLRDSTWGHAWLAEIVVLAVLAVALLWARRADSGWRLGALAVIALACVPALSGHAAASGMALPIALDVLHVLAAGGWMGTLLVLLVAGLPATRQLSLAERPAGMATLVNAFSPIALSCAALLVATGVLASIRNIESFAALMQSRYGNMLLRKLFFLVVAALIGMYNWRRARPALAVSGDDAAIRRAMQAELAAGAVILLLTAYLVAIPTPADLLRP